MEEGKRFHRLKVGEYTGWIRRGEDSPELRKALADPNGWLESESCRILKHNATTTVARAALPGQNQTFFLKRYNRKDAWEKTKNLFRYSRALKVWRAGYALEILGIPTPRVICALEKRQGPLVLEAFILTEWLEGGVGLDDFYRERCGPRSGNPLPEKDRRELEKTVAHLFATLHSHRISHGDLKGRNVLLDPSRPAPFDPRFVDLDAMTLSPRRFRRARVNDLARLLFSVYPIPCLLRQVRFFKDYSRGDKETWESRRKWFGKIRSRTTRKLKEKGLLP
jgi:tRNA A-37 threonylcarbamoyl transferase component Bud32